MSKPYAQDTLTPKSGWQPCRKSTLILLRSKFGKQVHRRLSIASMAQPFAEERWILSRHNDKKIWDAATQNLMRNAERNDLSRIIPNEAMCFTFSA